MSYDPGTYTSSYNSTYDTKVSGTNYTASDGSGHFEGTRYTPDGGTEYVRTYYHDGSSFETSSSSSYSGK